MKRKINLMRVAGIMLVVAGVMLFAGRYLSAQPVSWWQWTVPFLLIITGILNYRMGDRFVSK